MKTIARVPFTEIESVPALIRDFLNDETVGFGDHLFTKENIQQKIQQKWKWFSVDQRKLIVEVLAEQNINSSASQRQNIEKLKQTNTYTVCTGHQLNLFTGPVFFVYKILQTIKTAQFLSEELPDAHFVPVFWMATEDHDFEEISFFKAFGNRYETTADGSGAVGRLQLSDRDFISRFTEDFQGFPFADELIKLIAEAYQKDHTLADATRFIVNKLFAEYGLLVLDGDDARLKEQMKPIFRDELLNSSLQQHSEKNVETLTQQYKKVQVNPREINLFYLEEGRNRIDRSEEGFQIADTEIFFSREQIVEILEESPEKFSPNALMRPVFQEMILPNVAYIGGNAEIMYWLELPDYFVYLNLPFPVMIPRSSFLMLSQKQEAKLERLDISVQQLLSSVSKVQNVHVQRDNSLFSEIRALNERLSQQFDTLEQISRKTDITFGNLVNAEKTRQLRSLERMEKRLLRAEKRKNTDLMDRIERIFAEIHPNGSWQERQVNFSEFYLIHGKKWLETCLEEMDPFSPELVIMVD